MDYSYASTRNVLDGPMPTKKVNSTIKFDGTTMGYFWL